MHVHVHMRTRCKQACTPPRCARTHSYLEAAELDADVSPLIDALVRAVESAVPVRELSREPPITVVDEEREVLAREPSIAPLLSCRSLWS